MREGRMAQEAQRGNRKWNFGRNGHTCSIYRRTGWLSQWMFHEGGILDRQRTGMKYLKKSISHCILEDLGNIETRTEQNEI